MSGDAKRWKGQIQTYEGGPTGESIATTLFSYNSIGLVEYLGESRYAIPTNAPKWHLQKLEYNQIGEVSKIATAVNETTTKSTSLIVNPYSASETAIIVNGGFTYLTQVNDKVFLKTALNYVGGSRITQVLNANTIVIANTGQVAETTTINDSDLVISIESDDYKDFHNRVWDLREYYVYK
jgi:hypothetical protein